MHIVDKGEFEKAEQLERLRPLHEGNLCTVTEERTIINNANTFLSDRMLRNDGFDTDDYSQFIVDNKTILEKVIVFRTRLTEWLLSNATQDPRETQGPAVSILVIFETMGQGPEPMN